MINKAEHIAWAAEAIAIFQTQCGTGDEHAIADLICDLGHLADVRGFEMALTGLTSRACARTRARSGLSGQ